MDQGATRVVAVVTTVGSAWYAGTLASMSTRAVPGILASPKRDAGDMAQQWMTLYQRGKALGPLFGLATAAGYGVLAFLSSSSRRQSAAAASSGPMGFAAAGAMCLATIPFTAGFMAKVGSALVEGVAGGMELHVAPEMMAQLMERWAKMNLVKSMFPLVGAMVGMWSMLEL